MKERTRPSILVVDDNKANIDLLVFALKEAYDISVAMDGETALEDAPIVLPDLILLDILMPNMDGYEVCRRLKLDARVQQIPVIFITAMNQPTDETKGFALGGVDFITKPVNPSVVRARVRTHLALRAAHTQLEAQNQLKNHFLGVVSHDLRSPLSSIRNLCDMLLNMELETSTRQELLQTIGQESERMLGLVNHLLDVSVIESGRLDLNLAPCDLCTLVKERLFLLDHAAKNKGIRLVSHGQSVPSCTLDRERVAQVIDNLLTNAIHYSPAGSQVEIRVGESQGKLFLDVVDQGPGIPPEEMERLFGAFQKLTARPTAGEKSTGLGLAIVQWIVVAHHGQVTVHNNPEGGATFRVLLPLPEAAPVATPPPATPPPNKPPQVRVLLVDDEAHVRKMMRVILEKMGCQVVAEGTNGQEAVTLYQTHAPDVVLMDVNMPILSGLEALQAIRAGHPKAFVVMLTSLVSQETVLACLEAGAVTYIRKDTPVAQMMRLIRESWLDRRCKPRHP